MSNHLVTSRTHSATFPSPEVSPYSNHDPIPKGWSSERVPLSSYRARRHVAASALMPFSSGRTLPSKWDDAERWISSPVSVGNNVASSSYYGVSRTTSHFLQHHSHSQRRSKSKSGPLGPAGLVSYGSFNSYSPVLGMGVIHGGGHWRNSVTIDSPSGLVARTRSVDHELGDVDTIDCDQGGRRSCPGHGVPDWLDFWSGPLSPHPTGFEAEAEDEGRVDRVISRRDMATQMFVAGEMSSSPSMVSTPNSSIVSTSHSPHPTMDEDGRNMNQSPESEVRDVQIDKQISTIGRSNSNSDQVNDDNLPNSIVLNTNKKNSKVQREEARIKAWENLQKAKAETAIQKLEMKLEKKRSILMEKIVEKHRKAEEKAQRMRSSLSKGDNEDQMHNHVIAKRTSKFPSFCRKIFLGSSVRSCSTCYPF